MHARELIELAALVSAQGPLLVRSEHQLPAGGIERYWTTSKVRIDRWTRSLKDLTLQTGGDARQRERRWPETRGVLEEILTGEILTRVWAAVLCAYDRSRGTDEAEPVARSVMIGHSEARHRVLRLLSHVIGMDARSAVRLNRLRRHAERWTDLLVGRLAGIQDVSEFAVDAKRAMDFADDAPSRQGFEASRLAWPLLLASLRKAFQRELGPISPNADLNAGIAARVLSCFPSEPLDSTGLFRSLWLLRITSVAEEAAHMVEVLLSPRTLRFTQPVFAGAMRLKAVMPTWR